MIEGRKAFGQDLNRLRTERGVSLDELASATKVRAILLHALEEGRFDDLPPAVFVEGYIKACARFLQADPEPLIECYRNLAGVPPTSIPLPPVSPIRPEDRGDGRWLKWGGVCLLLGGLALASYLLIGWMESSYPVSEPSFQISRGEGKAPRAPSEPLPEAQSGPETAPQPDSAALVPPTDGAASPPAVPPEPPVPIADGVKTPQPVGDLVLVANAACWCEIWADGERALYREMAAGERLALSGRRFKVNLGNAGAVELLFHGARVTLPAGEGRVVKGLDLPASGEPQQP